VQAILHFIGKSSHHTVDHHQRRHTQCDAYDRCQSDVSSPQIAIAQQQTIHGRSFGRAIKAIQETAGVYETYSTEQKAKQGLFASDFGFAAADVASLTVLKSRSLSPGWSIAI
jgi:hypothetical protein